jgi:hypothetical protein
MINQYQNKLGVVEGIFPVLSSLKMCKLTIGFFILATMIK